MGIPSYYKKLLDTVPGLIFKKRVQSDVNWLFMDFNCLIYHCLNREDTPEYLGNYQKDIWENQFLDGVITYCLKVIKEVDPKIGVYIAIDGIVPMAKMRQQRLRRFKSVWINNKSHTITDKIWDKNSITPGTRFMNKLKNKLNYMIKDIHCNKKNQSWILSSSDEAGEGEHKIMNEWRKGTYTGNFAVYGLDADLIILSILGHEINTLENNIWLFREEISRGKISYDMDGEEIFEWFSINVLKEWLSNEIPENLRRNFILNYCFAMSILGNDFIPSSLGLKIRDDGHSELLDILRHYTANNMILVDPHTYALSFNNLLLLFRVLSNNEEHNIYRYISNKQKQARNIGYNSDNPLMEIGENNWPLHNIEENILFNGNHLSSDWESKYLTHFFTGFDYPYSIQYICKEYLYGIQWVWGYYLGKMDSICFNWYYPFTLPPLWKWINAYLIDNSVLPDFPDKVLVKASDIRPVEQLCIVLPLESWSLIPVCPETKLPYIAPQFFPTLFSFESLGKRFFWECESLIPIISILEIKQLMKYNNSI